MTQSVGPTAEEFYRKMIANLVIQVLDVVHEVVVKRLVVGVDDPIQVREVAVEVDVVGVGAPSQEILSSLVKVN